MIFGLGIHGFMITLRQVKELISSDYLHASSEEIVFRAVIRWVKYDVDARQKQLPDLLNCVRMPLLRPQFLSDHVATEELVKSDHKCRYDFGIGKLILLISYLVRRQICSALFSNITALSSN